jgi:hypothetical protein
MPEQAFGVFGICTRVIFGRRRLALAGGLVRRFVDPALETRRHGRWLREAAVGLAAFREATACSAPGHLASTAEKIDEIYLNIYP